MPESIQCRFIVFGAEGDVVGGRVPRVSEADAVVERLSFGLTESRYVVVVIIVRVG
jgi:hypothetical protein